MVYEPVNRSIVHILLGYFCILAICVWNVSEPLVETHSFSLLTYGFPNICIKFTKTIFVVKDIVLLYFQRIYIHLENKTIKWKH